MKEKIWRIVKWDYFLLCLIVIFTLVIHFVIITNPSELILDEQHYIKDARSIIEKGETERPEHPPLAKLFVVAGIKMFGDNPWGWRVLPITFGTASIVLFYFLCRRLNMSPMASSIATFLLALENMTFIMASVAMLDVYYVTFMIGSFLLYVHRKYIASGIATGLGALAKLNGILTFPVVAIHWLFTRKVRSWWFLLVIFFAVITFIEFMILFDFLITRDFSEVSNPFARIKTMMDLSSSLRFENVEHDAASRPWEWLLSYKPMAFWYTPNYIGGISPSLWALTIPTFAYMVFRAIKRNEAALFGAAWFTGTYLFWIPVTFITDRISYPYYFYPTVGAVCIGMALGISQLIDLFKRRRSGKLKWTVLAIVIIILIAHLVSFLVLSPLISIDYYQMFYASS